MATVIGRRGRGARPERDSEGRMTLTEHLRELRSRLVKSVLAIVVFGAIGLIFYDPILSLLVDPFNDAAEEAGVNATINFAGIADPFTVPLKLALLTGFVLAAPVWIYQLWAFVTPALYRTERRWAAAVILTAAPLFLAGVALCIWLLPRGLLVLLDFTPDDVANIIAFNEYLSFVIRLIIVFGIAFLLPVFIVLLNAIGFLTGEALASSRRWIILGVFVFAAVATPTGDPVTLLALAIPMYLLFEISVLICRVVDHRRAHRSGMELSDDEATPDDELERLGRIDDES